MSDDIPDSTPADLERSLTALLHDSELPAKHGESRVVQAWAETVACLVRRCHAAESALAAARRTIATLEAEVERGCVKIDELECTLEDEEAAHQETLRLWKAVTAERDSLRERLEAAERRLSAQGEKLLMADLLTKPQQ